MVEVKLIKIIIDEKKQEQLIVLQEKKGERKLPIVVGINQALAIKMKLSRITPPRPLTHDLICSIIENLKFKVEKIVVDDLSKGIFCAKIHLAGQNKERVVVDARPSDSIAIAVRTGASIFIEERVFFGAL